MPHTLRHVFASELLRADANLRQIQELLGQKHLDSTQRYTRVTGRDFKRMTKSDNPRFGTACRWLHAVRSISAAS